MTPNIRRWWRVWYGWHWGSCSTAANAHTDRDCAERQSEAVRLVIGAARIGDWIMSRSQPCEPCQLCGQEVPA